MYNVLICEDMYPTWPPQQEPFHRKMLDICCQDGGIKIMMKMMMNCDDFHSH